MKIFGIHIETPRQTKARVEKAAEDVFVAYLNGLKDGMRMANGDAHYLKAAQSYDSKNVH